MDQLNNNKLIAVEFHCHTNYSRDSGNRIDHLIKQAREMGIERLAITDHNTISGALKAKEMAPDLIIVGEEVRTQSGELIAYFVEAASRSRAFSSVSRTRLTGTATAGRQMSWSNWPVNWTRPRSSTPAAGRNRSMKMPTITRRKTACRCWPVRTRTLCMNWALA
jgi:hypothetical protein